MKKLSSMISAGLFLTAACFGQEIPQNQVPSVVVNNFQKNFPGAFDTEWEMQGNLYKADFETGFSVDHEVWYNEEGNLARHIEEISKGALPGHIRTKIDSDFSSYSIDEIKKMTTDGTVTYTVELDSFTQDWKVTFDAAGKVLNQTAD